MSDSRTTENQVWQRTDQAPVNEWVCGYWRGTGLVDVVKYTHAQGWINLDRDQLAHPSCWAPLPTAGEMS